MTTSAQALEEIARIDELEQGAREFAELMIGPRPAWTAPEIYGVARRGWAEVERLTGQLSGIEDLRSVGIDHGATAREVAKGFMREADAAKARAEAAERENERLRKALKEIDRLSLVISSAVNYADPKHVEIVCAALREARAALGDQT